MFLNMIDTVAPESILIKEEAMGEKKVMHRSHAGKSSRQCLINSNNLFVERGLHTFRC